MISFNPEPYQKEALESLSTDKERIRLLSLPCGTGKTETFSWFAKQRAHLGPVLILMDKIALAEQTLGRLAAAFPGAMQVGGGVKRRFSKDTSAVIATVQSWKRIPKLPYATIILDECHHLNFERPESQYMRALGESEAVILGVTATPYRMGYGKIYGPGKFFTKMTFERSLLYMIEKGYSVRPILKGTANAHETKNLHIKMGEWDQKEIAALVSNEKKLAAQIEEVLSKAHDRKKIVWACANINHAEAVRRMLGNSACIVHSKMSHEKRREEDARFRKEGRHLVSVNVVSEGWDFPPTDCAVLLTPTRSPVKYVQFCGRALRIDRNNPSKKDALILDFGQVISNLGPLDNPRVREKTRGEGIGEIPIKQCPGCFTFIPLSMNPCEECGWKFDVEESTTKNAESKAIILSSEDKNKIYTEKIIRIKISKHTSLKGNECLKVYYYTNLIKSFVEYLVLKGYYYSRTEYRLSQFNLCIAEVAPFPSVEVSKIPSRISFKKTDYGIEVIELHFANEGVGDRNSVPNLAQ